MDNDYFGMLVLAAIGAIIAAIFMQSFSVLLFALIGVYVVAVLAGGSQ